MNTKEFNNVWTMCDPRCGCLVSAAELSIFNRFLARFMITKSITTDLYSSVTVQPVSTCSHTFSKWQQLVVPESKLLHKKIATMPYRSKNIVYDWGYEIAMYVAT